MTVASGTPMIFTVSSALIQVKGLSRLLKFANLNRHNRIVGVSDENRANA